MSNEEKTNDYENFEKGMIYMKNLKKGGVVEKRGDEETKSMPHAPVSKSGKKHPLPIDLSTENKKAKRSAYQKGEATGAVL